MRDPFMIKGYPEAPTLAQTGLSPKLYREYRKLNVLHGLLCLIYWIVALGITFGVFWLVYQLAIYLDPKNEFVTILLFFGGLYALGGIAWGWDELFPKLASRSIARQKELIEKVRPFEESFKKYYQDELERICGLIDDEKGNLSEFLKRKEQHYNLLEKFWKKHNRLLGHKLTLYWYIYARRAWNRSTKNSSSTYSRTPATSKPAPEPQKSTEAKPAPKSSRSERKVSPARKLLSFVKRSDSKLNESTSTQIGSKAIADFQMTPQAEAQRKPTPKTLSSSEEQAIGWGRDDSHSLSQSPPQSQTLPKVTRIPVPPAPIPKPPPPPKPDVRFRVAKKIDWGAVAEANRKTGLTGQAVVVELEKQYLEDIGMNDLADKVVDVTRTQGDGLGYDVLSFFEDGRQKIHRGQIDNHAAEPNLLSERVGIAIPASTPG